MTTIQKILNHSIAAPFYRQHAGAFLFLFFILFGIQPSFNDALKTHYAIIVGILSSPHFFLIAIGCWLLYALRVTAFLYSNLKKESYDFLFDLNALSPGRKFKHLLQLNLFLLIPVVSYGLIIVVIAAGNDIVAKGLLVMLIILLIVGISTLVSFILIRSAKGLQQVSRRRSLLQLPPTLGSFLLRHVFREQFVGLLIIKTLSFGCLYFFARTEASVFEERMLWLLYITSLIGHSTIIYKIFHFVEGRLALYKNFPVRRIVTVLSLFIVYAILLIPEFWALRGIVTNQKNIAEYVWMILTGPSLLLLLHALLYTEDMNMEEYLKLLFGVWIVFVFLSLSRSHWLLPAIAAVFGSIIFMMSYYSYEKKAEIEGLE